MCQIEREHVRTVQAAIICYHSDKTACENRRNLLSFLFRVVINSWSPRNPRRFRRSLGHPTYALTGHQTPESSHSLRILPLRTPTESRSHRHAELRPQNPIDLIHKTATTRALQPFRIVNKQHHTPPASGRNH